MKGNYDGTFVFAAFVVVLLSEIAMFVMPQTHEPPVPEPTVQILATRDRSIASYDLRERALTVSEHAPRETLVCMRKQCRLVEEWTEAK